MLKKLIKSLIPALLVLVISALQISPLALHSYIELPILMYHHFGEDVSNDMTVSEETFDMHMRTLCEAGYTAITFDELVGFVNSGIPLPENPICITMDDGYLSNYEIAYPILQKYNMKATVFVIGSMSGMTNYPVTNYPLTPYFTWAQAKEMQDSGVMDIECHTYDMHHYAPYESGERPIRENVLPLEIETSDEYEAALVSDISRYIAMSETRLGKTPTVFAYPNGKYTAESERILSDLGFTVTLTTEYRSNIIRAGKENALRLLSRYTVNDSLTAKELLKLIK